MFDRWYLSAYNSNWKTIILLCIWTLPILLMLAFANQEILNFGVRNFWTATICIQYVQNSVFSIC